MHTAYISLTWDVQVEKVKEDVYLHPPKTLSSRPYLPLLPHPRSLDPQHPLESHKKHSTSPWILMQVTLPELWVDRAGEVNPNLEVMKLSIRDIK